MPRSPYSGNYVFSWKNNWLAFRNVMSFSNEKRNALCLFEVTDSGPATSVNVCVPI